MDDRLASQNGHAASFGHRPLFRSYCTIGVHGRCNTRAWASLPHPLDRRRDHFKAERIVELADRIDILETYNPWCEASANQAAASLASNLGKVSATGSDAHSARELGRSWMEIDEYLDPADFLKKLRYARHVVTPESGTGRRV